MARKRKKREGEKKFESIKAKVKPIKGGKVSRIAELEEKKKIAAIKGDRVKMVPMVYAVLIVVVVAVIAVVMLLMTPSAPVNITPVKEGDIAQIRYTGKFQNGSVFDSGNFTFRVGAGEVISGVEVAVAGMKMGEKKTVTLPPEQAYGYYDPDNILSIPLVQELDRTEETTTEIFKLTFEEEPALNMMYQLEGMQWPIRVIDIQNQTVTMRHEPQDGMVFEMTDSVGNVYGSSRVSVTMDKITVTSYPVKGSTVTTVIGTGMITEVNETHMEMDLNHKLAGETLTFEITLLNFISY